MKRILTVVGTRPEFIKAAPVSRALHGVAHERLVSTGQHYDKDMASAFVEELDLTLETLDGPRKASPAVQLATMVEALSRIVDEDRPDVVVVYGDTTSTLAGALVATLSGVPLAHIEAGLRSFDKQMPEERNRILVDHVAALHFCPSDVAVENLRREGIMGPSVSVVGDVNLDALLMFRDRSRRPSVLKGDETFVLFTMHRQHNADDPTVLSDVLDGLAAAGQLVLWPIHPRTEKRIREFGLALPENIRVCPPLGFLEFLWTLDAAVAVVTDSGGVQKEAYWLGTPCITIRQQTEWVETVEAGWNTLVGHDRHRLAAALTRPPRAPERPDLYGDGSASRKIAASLLHALESWTDGRIAPPSDTEPDAPAAETWGPPKASGVTSR